MKLCVQLEAGIGLGIDILPTGQVKEVRGMIANVEVALPNGCDGTIIFAYKPLPKTPGNRPLLWVDARDLRTDSGIRMNETDLRAEIKRVNDERRADMMRGPLGENWP